MDPSKYVELIRDLVKGPGGKALEKALEAAFAGAAGGDDVEVIGKSAAAKFAKSSEFGKLSGEIARRG